MTTAAKLAAQAAGTAKAVTANRLVDGRVVYLTAEQDWTPRFAEAARFATDGEAVEAVGRVRACAAGREVVDIYPFDIEVCGTVGPRPLGRRETIRTRGPSVRPDLGYQANNG
ncbi:MAG TPA: DUF2849 domain-containing protein [Alphaproteobacteria bacterium]|nr:DUF2849 domain-containing protein [Alphaproteobacteria bacterium]